MVEPLFRVGFEVRDVERHAPRSLFGCFERVAQVHAAHEADARAVVSSRRLGVGEGNGLGRSVPGKGAFLCWSKQEALEEGDQEKAASEVRIMA